MTENKEIISKIRDLDLTLQTPKDMNIILNSLSDNFIIKTLRLSNLSNKEIDEETESCAENFKRSRVGTEIKISSANSCFCSSKNLDIEVFYPDAL